MYTRTGELDQMLNSGGVSYDSRGLEVRNTDRLRLQQVGGGQLAGDADATGAPEEAPAEPNQLGGPQSEAELQEEHEQQLQLLASRDNIPAFFPTVSIAALLRILKDPALQLHHTACLTAITNVFRALGISRSLSFVPLVIPNYLRAVCLPFPSYK